MTCWTGVCYGFDDDKNGGKSVNRVLEAIAQGRIARGYQINFAAPEVIEILGPLDFDFVWIDGEHGAIGLRDLENLCRAAELVRATVIARVPDIRASTVLGYLDRGVNGIVGPHIATGDDAQRLVDACYFGPRGTRSFGGNRGCRYDYGIDDKAEYYRQCNDDMLVCALLEDAGVSEALDDILAVDGIDYFHIGANDFAQGLGYPGESARAEVTAEMDAVYQRIRAAGRRVETDIMCRAPVKTLLVEAASRFLDEYQA